MGGICLTAAGAAVSLIAAALPVQAITLAWTHSIEKVRWEEDYRVIDHRLVLIEARIKGSGAGMEIPDDAQFANGLWRYRPALPPLARLRLTHSPYATDYAICNAGACRSLAELLPAMADTVVVTVEPCDSQVPLSKP